MVVTRASNNYGPYQFPEKLIPLMISNALEDKPLPVYGDGMQVRDWLYVEDHCRGILAVLEGGREGEIYNIGGNRSLPNIEVVAHSAADGQAREPDGESYRPARPRPPLRAFEREADARDRLGAADAVRPRPRTDNRLVPRESGLGTAREVRRIPGLLSTQLHALNADQKLMIQGFPCCIS